MGIIKKALHSKIDVFVKFESAINLEIRGQIKKKNWIPSIWVTGTICMHFHQNLGRSRLGHWVIELRIGGIFLPRNRPTLGPQVQSQSP